MAKARIARATRTTCSHRLANVVPHLILFLEAMATSFSRVLDHSLFLSEVEGWRLEVGGRALAFCFSFSLQIDFFCVCLCCRPCPRELSVGCCPFCLRK